MINMIYMFKKKISRFSDWKAWTTIARLYGSETTISSRTKSEDVLVKIPPTKIGVPSASFFGYVLFPRIGLIKAKSIQFFQYPQPSSRSAPWFFARPCAKMTPASSSVHSETTGVTWDIRALACHMSHVTLVCPVTALTNKKHIGIHRKNNEGRRCLFCHSCGWAIHSTHKLGWSWRVDSLFHSASSKLNWFCLDGDSRHINWW